MVHGDECKETAPNPGVNGSSSCISPTRKNSSRGQAEGGRQGKPNAERVRWRDLPNKDQLFILGLCRLSEPLSNVCLLPYIFYLVQSILAVSSNEGPDATSVRVSKYSGLLVAAFPLAQFFVSLPWGRISDVHGRRPSILGGLLISVAANVGFGLSKSISTLLFWRILAGLANGNTGIMRTVTAEIVQERKYQSKAFLLLPLVFNSGMVASIAVGGLLADPATNLPSIFGPTGLLNTNKNPDGVQWALSYPYALPAILNATILAVALLFALFGLRETLPGKEHQGDLGLKAGRAMGRCTIRLLAISERYNYTVVDETEERLLGDAPLPDEKSIATSKPGRGQGLAFRDIWTRKVLCSLLSFGLLPLHNSAFMHIFPVYLSSPTADNSKATFYAFQGGLGLRSATIGIWLSTFGVCGILLQLFIYPRIQAKLGTRGVLQISLSLFPITYALAPYLSLLVEVHEVRWAFLGLIVYLQIMARTMAIPSTVILLTESAPDKSVLGTIHGAGNMIASFARAVGPAVGGYIFAWGVEKGIVGLVWWLYLVTIATGAFAWLCLMDKGVSRTE